MHHDKLATMYCSMAKYVAYVDFNSCMHNPVSCIVLICTYQAFLVSFMRMLYVRTYVGAVQLYL